MTASVDYGAVLDTVVLAVHAAGRFIAAEAAGRMWPGADLKLRSKTDPTDYVTAVDEAVERRLVSYLRQQYPEFGVLAEEGTSRDPEAEHVWLLDPLDGTRNFVKGHPGYCVSLALVRDGQPVIGIVYDIEADALYSSFLGGGARLNGRRLQVGAEADARHCVAGVGYPVGIRRDGGQRERYLRLLSGTAALRQGGSVARELALVARGALDAFWQPLLSPWDIAAGMLLVTEAGGRVEPLSEGPWLSAGTLGVFAASDSAFDPVKELIR